MTLLELLKQIPETRNKLGRQYDLAHIVLFVILATLAGANGYTTCARWIKLKWHILKPVFGLKWFKAPSKSALQRIISGIDELELEKVLRTHSLSLLPPQKGYLSVAIDGKTLRGSYDNQESTGSRELVSLLATGSEITLAAVLVENKESEITAFRELLSSLDYNGLQITADALHTQKKQLS